jgi:hypothetical protein
MTIDERLEALTRNLELMVLETEKHDRQIGALASESEKRDRQIGALAGESEYWSSNQRAKTGVLFAWASAWTLLRKACSCSRWKPRSTINS